MKYAVTRYIMTESMKMIFQTDNYTKIHLYTNINNLLTVT